MKSDTMEGDTKLTLCMKMYVRQSIEARTFFLTSILEMRAHRNDTDKIENNYDYDDDLYQIKYILFLYRLTVFRLRQACSLTHP